MWRQWLGASGIENAVDKLKELLSGQEPISNIASDITTYQPKEQSDLMNPKKYWTGLWENVKQNILQRREETGETVADKAIKIGGAAGILLGVVRNMSQYYQQSLKPNTVMGAQSGGGRLQFDMANFTVFEYGITRERAEIIDRFFTAYGYATNRFGKPYLFSDTSKARPYINYVQTTGANVNGSLPKDSADAIAAIFDAGVRFWTAQPSGGHPSPLANVNNYSALENLNAPPVG